MKTAATPTSDANFRIYNLMNTYRVRILALFQRLFAEMAARGFYLVRFETPGGDSYEARFQLPSEQMLDQVVTIRLSVSRSEKYPGMEAGKVGLLFLAEPQDGPQENFDVLAHTGWCGLDEAEELEARFARLERADLGAFADSCRRMVVGVEPVCSVGGCWAKRVVGTEFCAFGPSHKLKTYFARWYRDRELIHAQKDTLEVITKLCRMSGLKAEIVGEGQGTIGHVFPDGKAEWY